MAKFKLDEVDHQILDILIDNTRIPFTDISKKLLISAGTVHVRVKKMEDAGIIKGSTLNLDYVKLGYSFIAYVGIFLEKNNMTDRVLQALKDIPFVTVAHITTGRFNIFCKVRATDTKSAKEKADELAKAITDSKFIFNEKMLPIQVAVGVYTFNGTEDVSQALAEADKDMYANKRQIKENYEA